MKPLTGQIVGWVFIAFTSSLHYFVAFLTRGLGYTLPFENMMNMQFWFGLMSLLIAGVFRSAGMRYWQGFLISIGVQSILFSQIVFTLRDNLSSSLEKSAAVACLIGGILAVSIAYALQPLTKGRKTN